jgi:MFS family permease
MQEKNVRWESHPSMTAPAGDPAGALNLRSIAPSAFLPALIYEIGNGAIAPVIALTALGLGASTATAGLILTLLGVGQIVGNLPSSFLVNRLGDRRAMIVAALVAAAALVVCSIAPDLLVFGGAVAVIGMCNATFYLGRQHYITEVVPPLRRAVALSTLGGSHRIGLFIGPFAGAAAIHLWSTRAAFAVAVVAALSAALALILIPDLERLSPATSGPPPRTPLRTVLATHRRVFVTLGFGVLAVGAVRAARSTVLPLWAAHTGLDATTTSLIFGVASAVDMALFYPSGQVMDRFGRLSIAVPSMVVLGGATTLLPLTRTGLGLTLVAMAMSFGNGIGSGIIMTLGADVAPIDGKVSFLSVWRTMSDTGGAAGPLLVSAVATAWSLAAGIVAVGTVGLLAALALNHWVPSYSPYANRRMVRAARNSAAP